jgi:hypothetical protein
VVFDKFYVNLNFCEGLKNCRSRRFMSQKQGRPGQNNRKPFSQKGSKDAPTHRVILKNKVQAILCMHLEIFFSTPNIKLFVFALFEITLHCRKASICLQPC